MSNSRSFRRKLKAGRHVRPSGQEQPPRQPGQYSKGRVPWNKGLALTTRPCLSTVRRWLEACVAEGTVERKIAEPDGKPGRPPVMYHITEKGLGRPSAPEEVWKVQMKRLRRWENAKQRSRAQRYARKLAKLEQEKGRIGRRLTVLQDAAEQARAKLLTAELVAGAIEGLIEADGGTAALHPEEVDALVEAGVVIQKGDGVLSLAEDCLEAFDRIASGLESVTAAAP